MPTRAGRGFVYRGAPEEVGGDSYDIPSGNPPFLATDAMFKIFDAPALDDIKRRLNMVSAGMSIESAFPSGSPQMKAFERYYGTMPGPTTISTPSEVMGYDTSDQPIMKPGSTFTSPGLYPGGVPNWAVQQVAKGEKIPEELAAATGLTKTPTSSQIFAPQATAALAQLKGDLEAQKRYRSVLNDLRKDRPNATEETLNNEAMWTVNQQTGGRLFRNATRPSEEELGPSKQQSKQSHEKLQQAEKNVSMDARVERRIEAQAARQEMLINWQRENAAQTDATKRRGQDILKEKYEQEKIRIFTKTVTELDDVVGAEDAFRIAKDLGSGKKIEDLDYLTPTAQAIIQKNINKSDEWHAAKVAKAVKASAGGDAGAMELKRMGVEIKLATAMMNMQKLAQSDPGAKQQLDNLKFLVTAANSMERSGDREGAKTVQKFIADQYGFEGVGEPGMIGKLFSIFSKPSAAAGTGAAIPQARTAAPAPDINSILGGVRERLDQLRGPQQGGGNVIPAPQNPMPQVPSAVRPGPPVQQYAPAPQGPTAPGMTYEQYGKGIKSAEDYAKKLKENRDRRGLGGR